jgi:hypothetical protein
LRGLPLAHCRQRVAGIEARRLGESEGFAETSHASIDEKTGDLDRARLVPHRVSALELSNQLKLTEGGVELSAFSAIAPATGGGCRRVEDPAAQRPGTLVPFGGRAVGGRPGVTGKVERTSIDDRPVQEIGLGLLAYLLVSNMSMTKNLPAVSTKRFSVVEPAN